MVWPLALCLDDAKQDSVVYGGEFEAVVFLVKVHVLHSYRRASTASVFTIRVLRESANFGWPKAHVSTT